MKKILFLFIIFSVTFAAQKKEIVLEDIWSNGNFRTECLFSFQSPAEGDYLLIQCGGGDDVDLQNLMHVKITLIEANTQHDSETYPYKLIGFTGVKTQDYIFIIK